MSPAARYLITNLNIDPARLQGTGKHGMITKEDITKFVQAGGNAQASKPVAAAAAAPAPAVAAPASSVEPVNSRFKDIPNNNMRKIIAKRLTESKAQVPHYYTSIEVNVDAVLNLRKKLKKEYDLNVSVNDFVIKAAALALRDVPEANSKWNPQAGKVVASPGVDISVAVATPNGLITPILFQADRRSLVEINKTVKDLATRARDGKLKPEEFQGGSFSISNLGNFIFFSFLFIDSILISINLLFRNVWCFFLLCCDQSSTSLHLSCWCWSFTCSSTFCCCS